MTQTSGREMVLERFGRGCARQRWIVVVTWAVVTVGVVAAGVAFGGQADNALTIPGASSEEALDVLEEEFPEAAGASATVVFHTTDPGTTVTDTSIEADIESSITAIKALADVELVTDPFTTSGSVSSDGRTAVATVLYTIPQADLPDNGISTFDDLQDAIEPYRSSTLEVELGGALASTQPVGIEDIYVLYGLLVALAILLVTLGTWWSFAWPVLGALAGVGLGTGLLALLQDIVSMPTISGTVGVMVGLGVGIDYGLFVCSRYKDAVAEGCDPREAAGRALSTSGRAVLTAGATVLVALLALLVFDVPAVSAMAYAVVIFVTCAILAAVTLQPAICALVGRRITHGHVPFVRAQRSESPDATPRALGLRWAGFVTRWAAPVAVVGFVVLLVLAAPVYSGQFRLGPLDNSLYPTSSTQYKANELQASEFGAGSTDPLLIVTEIASDDSSASSQLDSLISAIEGTTGVAAVSSAETNAAGDLAIFEVTPTTDAQDEATAELVDRLRDDTIPTATSGTGLTALVSGTTAVFADLDTRIADRLVLFIALVILLAMLILAVAFRSILIPLKAATLNILTILATYGVLVAVFTEGWGLSVLGVPSEVPILSLLAPVIFAVLFGLSNDYEVYLVNRMREQYQKTSDARRAVVLGHGRGSRIVIAAALVMIFVFVSYVLQPSTPVKQFGFGMTVAILIDCFVTRMAILPALMRLGGAAMWFPGLRTRASHRDTGSSS